MSHPTIEETDFHYWTTVTTRFCDQDGVGHINNVAYAAYVESGRIDYLGNIISAGQQDRDAVRALILARLSINYHREMFYPGDVRVGSRVARIGNSSFVVACALFKDGVLHASADNVMVCIDPDSGQSREIPQDLRERLEAERSD